MTSHKLYEISWRAHRFANFSALKPDLHMFGLLFDVRFDAIARGAVRCGAVRCGAVRCAAAAGGGSVVVVVVLMVAQ